MGDVYRATKKDLGGGAMIELGCYLLQYANLVFREFPEKISAVANLSEPGKSFI